MTMYFMYFVFFRINNIIREKHEGKNKSSSRIRYQDGNYQKLMFITKTGGFEKHFILKNEMLTTVKLDYNKKPFVTNKMDTVGWFLTILY